MLTRCKKPDIVFVTESWLDCSITDGCVDPSGCYSIYRSDRAHRVGGGVSAAVSKVSHSYRVVVPSQFQSVEVECFEVVTDTAAYRFIVLYRPPEFNAIGRDYIKQLCDSLRYLCDTQKSVIIVGDLNLPHIDWSANTAPLDSIHSEFLECCEDYGFNQYVHVPTRDFNILDLVLSNNPYLVNSVDVVELFSNSDHSMVNFQLVLHVHECKETEKPPVYDYAKADVDAIACALMTHPFNVSSVTGSADDVWSDFINPVFKIIYDFVPLKSFVPTNKSTRFKKYPRHITRAALWRCYRQNRSLANKVAYSQQAEVCKSLVFEYERTNELRVINKSTVGAYYRFVNKRLSAASGVGPLKSEHTGLVITDDSSKATLLNDYFGSVFNADNGILLDFARRVSESVSCNDITITPDRILKYINKSSLNTAPGPDGIPNSFIKQFKCQLLNPLVAVFKYFVDIGEMPSMWKTANVTPVLKKGLASDVSNYRPISLTCNFCKLFERLVQERMLDSLLSNNLISSQQHGFLAKHSTCTRLLETVNDWSIALRNCHSVDVVYFDFAKAFDTVTHKKLLYKLHAYGFGDKLVNLISSFLVGRSQRVMLPNGFSSWRPVGSGVPQCSVLGPLLFLLYINDITDMFVDNIAIKLFADDIKIYMEIADNSQAAAFQDSINGIVRWADLWQLQLSYRKCQHMRVTLHKTDFPQTYLLCGDVLPSVMECRDLGITVDSTLSFTGHICNIVAKAKQRSSQILRFFLSQDPQVLRKAFVVYVRPILEYSSPVWSPSAVTYINKLESVQRSFTKRLPGFLKLSYDTRLKRLGLDRLEIRRLHADLIMCYKMVHKLVNIPFDQFFYIQPTK